MENTQRGVWRIHTAISHSLCATEIKWFKKKKGLKSTDTHTQKHTCTGALILKHAFLHPHYICFFVFLFFTHFFPLILTIDLFTLFHSLSACLFIYLSVSIYLSINLSKLPRVYVSLSLSEEPLDACHTYGLCALTDMDLGVKLPNTCIQYLQ